MPCVHRHLPGADEQPDDAQPDRLEPAEEELHDRSEEVTHRLEDGEERAPAPLVHAVENRQQPPGEERIRDVANADEHQRVGEEVGESRDDDAEGHREAVAQRLRTQHDTAESDSDDERSAGADQFETSLDDVPTTGDVGDGGTGGSGSDGEPRMRDGEAGQQEVQAEAGTDRDGQVGDVQHELVVRTLVVVGEAIDLLAAVDELVETLPDLVVTRMQSRAETVGDHVEARQVAHPAVRHVEQREGEEEDGQSRQHAGDDRTPIAVDEARVVPAEASRETGCSSQETADDEVATIPVEHLARQGVGQTDDDSHRSDGGRQRQSDGAAQPSRTPASRSGEHQVGALLGEVARAGVLLLIDRLDERLEGVAHPGEQVVAEEEHCPREDVGDGEQQCDGAGDQRGEQAETEERSDERSTTDDGSDAERQTQSRGLSVVEPLADDVDEQGEGQNGNDSTRTGGDTSDDGNAGAESGHPVGGQVASPTAGRDGAGPGDDLENLLEKRLLAVFREQLRPATVSARKHTAEVDDARGQPFEVLASEVVDRLPEPLEELDDVTQQQHPDDWRDVARGEQEADDAGNAGCESSVAEALDEVEA